MSRGLKKIDAITIAVLFGCVGALGLWLLCSPIVSTDDIWLYVVCQNIKNGEVIYRDFSVVTTPLFYLIYSLPLHICDTFFTFKLTNILIAGIYLVWVYYACEKLNIYKGVRMFLLMYECAFYLMLGSSAEYNVLAQYFISGAMYVTYVIYKEDTLNIRAAADEKTEDKKRPTCSIGRLIELAVLIAAIILSKYTVGAVITLCIGILLIFFVCIKRIRVIHILMVVGADVLIAGITIAVLAAFGALSGFFDCLFGGVGSFSRGVFYLNHILGTLGTTPLFIVGASFMFAAFILSIVWKARVVGYFCLFIFADMIVIYPIPNQFHLSLVCIPTAVFLMIAAKELSEHMMPIPKSRLKYRRSRMGYFTCFGVIFLLIAPCVVLIAVPYFTKDNVSLYGTKYYNEVGMVKSDYDKISEMLTYVNSHPEFDFYSPEDVYSCIESIHGNNIDGKWNCMLQGNIGSDSVINRIQSIEGQENVRIFIYSDPDDMFWQSFSEAEEYVRDNYTYIETVGKFDVYSME